MEVKVNVKGVKQLQKLFAKLPPSVIKAGMTAFVEFILGGVPHGLRHYPPEKYVSRKRAGYKTSLKQIRFFFATGIWTKGPNGTVILHKYKRTDKIAKGWYMKSIKGGYSFKVGNKEPGAYYTSHEVGRARMNKLIGWKTIGQSIASNFNGAMKKARTAVRDALAKIKK